ncbi:MAG: hypothetical protein ACK523_01855 [Pirellulaceae bacterium]
MALALATTVMRVVVQGTVVAACLATGGGEAASRLGLAEDRWILAA